MNGERGKREERGWRDLRAFYQDYIGYNTVHQAEVWMHSYCKKIAKFPMAGREVTLCLAKPFLVN